MGKNFNFFSFGSLRCMMEGAKDPEIWLISLGIFSIFDTY